ncbi:MAG: hypothetical protein PHY45_16070 [Rhodocyclaceae bacterium]|nr:hypothetical protein [Rhodocyclaceae bacterium]
MLCLQQCIDLCELTPEEAQAVRERATLEEILAIQAECRNIRDGGAGADPAESMRCGMLNMRNQLIEEVEAAGDFDDLENVVHHYCAYALARDTIGSDGAEGG